MDDISQRLSWPSQKLPPEATRNAENTEDSFAAVSKTLRSKLTRLSVFFDGIESDLIGKIRQ
jgi:hypothetical protein